MIHPHIWSLVIPFLYTGELQSVLHLRIVCRNWSSALLDDCIWQTLISFAGYDPLLEKDEAQKSPKDEFVRIHNRHCHWCNSTTQAPRKLYALPEKKKRLCEQCFTELFTPSADKQFLAELKVLEKYLYGTRLSTTDVEHCKKNTILKGSEPPEYYYDSEDLIPIMRKKRFQVVMQKIAPEFPIPNVITEAALKTSPSDPNNDALSHLRCYVNADFSKFWCPLHQAMIYMCAEYHAMYHHHTNPNPALLKYVADVLLPRKKEELELDCMGLLID